jgi:ADP-heptose:LPS heptosyltransferase
MTAAIRDLHLSNPGKFVTDVRTPADALFENNPYITRLDDNDPDVEKIRMEYPLIHESNQGAHHFIHGFAQFLEKKLRVHIHVSKLKGDIYISDEEKGWYSQFREIMGEDAPFWIINAGSKDDFTAKQWDHDRYQEVVNKLPNTFFVQVGASEHNHRLLEGNNVIDLVGKTDLRQFVRLIYHSYGVITPVSMAMHLAAAIEPHPRYNKKSRPCVVIAGGREPMIWEAYTNHAYLHTCGMLDCCDEGGCWKSRTVPLGDGDPKDHESLCVYPVKVRNGHVPKCLDMIKADDVVRKVQDYD